MTGSRWEVIARTAAVFGAGLRASACAPPRPPREALGLPPSRRGAVSAGQRSEATRQPVCGSPLCALALTPHSVTAPGKPDTGPRGRTYTTEMGKRSPWRAGCWTLTGTGDKKVKRLGLEPTCLSLPSLCHCPTHSRARCNYAGQAQKGPVSKDKLAFRPGVPSVLGLFVPLLRHL